MASLAADMHWPGPGVYALVFDTGTKFGVSRTVRSRIRQYQRPWMRQIQSSIVVKLPAMALLSVEASAIINGFSLAGVHPRDRDGEFVPRLNHKKATRALARAIGLRRDLIERANADAQGLLTEWGYDAQEAVAKLVTGGCARG